MIAKDVVLPNGFTASFWKLDKRLFNDIAQSCTLVISGWRDQQAFADGLEPAQQFTRTFTGPQYTAISGRTVTQVEAAIVNNIDIFAGGVVS
jgi:hypothetical protein